MMPIRTLTIATALLTACGQQATTASSALLASTSMPRQDGSSLAVGFLTEVYSHHDVDAAQRALGEPFIQHDPGVPDGRAATVDALRAWVAANPQGRIEVKRVIADGDLVLVHSNYHQQPGDRGTAGIDLFRVEHGKLVEHWEAMQPVPEKTANGHTMFDSVYPDTARVDRRTVERNKRASVVYLGELFDPSRIDQAVQTYLPEDGYIQHNPNIPDGAQALLNGLKMGYQQGMTLKADVRHLLGERDLVAQFSHYTGSSPQGTFESVTVDLFRFKDGKILEHWDVSQPLSDTPANNNGQF